MIQYFVPSLYRSQSHQYQLLCLNPLRRSTMSLASTKAPSLNKNRQDMIAARSSGSFNSELLTELIYGKLGIIKRRKIQSILKSEPAFTLFQHGKWEFQSRTEKFHAMLKINHRVLELYYEDVLDEDGEGRLASWRSSFSALMTQGTHRLDAIGQHDVI